MFISVSNIYINACVHEEVFHMFELPVPMYMLYFEPCLWYTCMTCLIAMAMVVDFSFFISSAVQNCIACDTLMTNGTSLIYMMSVSKVTLPCLFSFSVSRSSSIVTTHAIFLHVVWPWSGPISSAFIMSALITGRFRIIVLSVYLVKSSVVGQSMIFCKDCVHTGSEYSLMVYLDLFSIYCVNEYATNIILNIREEHPFFGGSKYPCSTIHLVYEEAFIESNIISPLCLHYPFWVEIYSTVPI